MKPWLSGLKPNVERLSAYAATSGFIGTAPGSVAITRGLDTSSAEGMTPAGAGADPDAGAAATSTPGLCSAPVAARLGEAVPAIGSVVIAPLSTDACG